MWKSLFHAFDITRFDHIIKMKMHGTTPKECMYIHLVCLCFFTYCTNLMDFFGIQTIYDTNLHVLEIICPKQTIYFSQIKHLSTFLLVREKSTAPHNKWLIEAFIKCYFVHVFITPVLVMTTAIQSFARMVIHYSSSSSPFTQ